MMRSEVTLITPPRHFPQTGRSGSMGKHFDITGRRFGRLIAINPTIKRSLEGHVVWFCRCDCGKHCFVSGHELRRGNTSSCGCRGRNYKHGHARRGNHNPLYDVWTEMRSRCRNPNHHSYKNYGGRGIKVCKRWLKFENFLTDVGARPPSTSLDRYPNNNGNYKPSNVRWATRKEQRA